VRRAPRTVSRPRATASAPGHQSEARGLLRVCAAGALLGSAAAGREGTVLDGGSTTVDSGVGTVSNGARAGPAATVPGGTVDVVARKARAVVVAVRRCLAAGVTPDGGRPGAGGTVRGGPVGGGAVTTGVVVGGAVGGGDVVGGSVGVGDVVGGSVGGGVVVGSGSVVVGTICAPRSGAANNVVPTAVLASTNAPLNRRRRTGDARRYTRRSPRFFSLLGDADEGIASPVTAATPLNGDTVNGDETAPSLLSAATLSPRLVHVKQPSRRGWRRGNGW
jgi:hypothetical protein